MVFHFKCSKKAKTQRKLKASYIALLKPDFNEEKDFEDWFYLEMVSHRAINDTTQTPNKEVHFFFFSVCFMVFNCS